jgi:RHS repeat-associated protein
MNQGNIPLVISDPFLSGSLQGAGGIGGLLARTANPPTLTPQLSTFATAFYHADGNGNVTCLIYTNQTIAAKYEYDPYGNIMSQSGALAGDNLYRFSSEECHTLSGFVYYLYRYYNPNLQRWLNRDSLGELGFEKLRSAGLIVPVNVPSAYAEGFNLFCFLKNEPISYLDFLGLRHVLSREIIYSDSKYEVAFDPFEDVKGVLKVVKTAYEAFEMADGLIGERTGGREYYIDVPDDWVSTARESYHLQDPSWSLFYPAGAEPPNQNPNPIGLFGFDIIVHLYLQRDYMWHCPGFNPPGLSCQTCNQNSPVTIPPITLP